jgi:hypothetical protein
MSDHVSVDASEVAGLARILAEAPDIAIREVRAVVKRGAQNIKTDAQRRISGLAHAPAYPRAISYDTHDGMSKAWAEIGPDKNKRQGALGNILEYGTVKNPPIPHMAPAAAAERPRFEKALEDAAAKATGLQ